MGFYTGRFFVSPVESISTRPNCSGGASTTNFEDGDTAEFVDPKNINEAGENPAPKKETSSGISTSRGKFKKCWNRLKRFKNLFKRNSANLEAERTSNSVSNSDKRRSKLSTKISFLTNLFRRTETVVHVEDSSKIEKTIEIKIEETEEIEMKTLQTSPSKETSSDEETSSDSSLEKASLTDALSSRPFKNLKPLMSPVKQKKLIAQVKIQKLKTYIQKGLEINKNLEEAEAKFIIKKPKKKTVRFAVPEVSHIFSDEEESKINLNELIKHFMKETGNLEPEIKPDEDVQHVFLFSAPGSPFGSEEKESLVPVVEPSEDSEYVQMEKENLVPRIESSENPVHLQDKVTSGEERQMVSPLNDKPEVLTGMKKWQVRRHSGKSLNGLNQVREFGTPLEC